MNKTSVILLAAVTADGFIARSANDRSFDWTSWEDKKFYVEQIKTVDAIIMGRKSFETFSKYPKNSRWVLYTSKPETFVNPKPTVIKAEATDEDPRQLIERLTNEGCQRIAICGGASIYTIFMNAGLVDTLFLTVEPVLFGSGVSLFSQKIKDKYAHLSIRRIHNLSDQTKVFEYLINQPS